VSGILLVERAPGGNAAPATLDTGAAAAIRRPDPQPAIPQAGNPAAPARPAAGRTKLQQSFNGGRVGAVAQGREATVQRPAAGSGKPDV